MAGVIAPRRGSSGQNQLRSVSLPRCRATPWACRLKSTCEVFACDSSCAGGSDYHEPSTISRGPARSGSQSHPGQGTATHSVQSSALACDHCTCLTIMSGRACGVLVAACPALDNATVKSRAHPSPSSVQ
jgi:hypothetical protein